MSLFRPNDFILFFLFALTPFLFLAACTQGSESPTPENSEMTSPDRRPNCPTCGMHADMTLEWQATIEYQDGIILYFDVPEHMLAFYVNPDQYQATDVQRDLSNVARITVTDYESKSPFDAREAFYVIESNVKSPMGEGIIPFRSKESAQEFQAQNGGRILVFSDLTAEVVQEIQ